MRRAGACPRRLRGFFAAHSQVPPHPTWLSLWESWRRSRLRGVACRRCQCEPDTLVVAPRHWGTPGSIQGGGRTKTFPLGGRWPGEAGSDEGHSVEATTSARKPTFPPLISQKSKIFASFPRGGSFFLVQAPGSLWESCCRGGRRGLLRYGKTLSAQCAHWAPLPKGEARRRAAKEGAENPAPSKCSSLHHVSNRVTP